MGISISYLSQLIPALSLVRCVRKHLPGTAIILGGAYLTATDYEIARVPVSTLQADAVALYDGELVLDAWLASILRDGPKPSLSNLYVRDGEKYRPTTTGPSPRIDLDDLPTPMWTADGLALGSYLVPKYPIALPLSRGCYWGRCVFCNISSQTASRYRKRSVEKAVEDIRAAVLETGSNWFDFPVDSFKPKDLHALSRALLDAGVEIEWGAEVLLDPGVQRRCACRSRSRGLSVPSLWARKREPHHSARDEQGRQARCCASHPGLMPRARNPDSGHVDRGGFHRKLAENWNEPTTSSWTTATESTF